MKENDKYINIRKLLERWYSGETSPSEERWLTALLCADEDLPADLEADRKLFTLFANEKLAVPEIPAEVARRVASALDEEIAATMGQTPRMRRSFTGRTFRRLSIGAAACLAIIFGTRQFVDRDLSGMSEGMVSGLVNTTQTVFSTLTVDSLANKSPEPQMIASVSPVRPTVKAAVAAPDCPPTMKKRTQNQGEAGNRPTENGICSRSAKSTESISGSEANSGKSSVSTNDRPSVPVRENVLMADAASALSRPSNYRIVESYDEADAILGSILSSLNQYMEIESSRLSEIGLEYASEVQKVNIINELPMARQTQKI